MSYVQFMSYKNDGYSTLVEFLEYVHDFHAGSRVEVSRRLVGKNHNGIVHQRPGYSDSLLLSSGKLV